MSASGANLKGCGSRARAPRPWRWSLPPCSSSPPPFRTRSASPPSPSTCSSSAFRWPRPPGLSASRGSWIPWTADAWTPSAACRRRYPLSSSGESSSEPQCASPSSPRERSRPRRGECSPCASPFSSSRLW